MTLGYDGMFLGVHEEAHLIVLSLMAGAVLGAVYDILRAARLSVKHNTAAVLVEDLIFVVLFGTVYYAFCVELLEGRMRAFALAGFSAGFAVYILTLGRIVCGALSAALETLVKILGLLVKTFKKPIKHLCGLPFLSKLKKKTSKTSCNN